VRRQCLWVFCAWICLQEASGWGCSLRTAASRLVHLIRQTHCTCLALSCWANVLQTYACRASSSARAADVRADVRCSRATYGSDTSFSALIDWSTLPLTVTDPGLAQNADRHVRWHRMHVVHCSMRCR
jgi:hypothetical protein